MLLRNVRLAVGLPTRLMGRKVLRFEAGLAIYAARGLWSRSAEITAVALTACRGWQFFSKIEMRKLDIFQVASNVSLVAETGVRKKSVSMWKLKLRELDAKIVLIGVL